MIRTLSGICLSLISLAAAAAVKEETTAVAELPAPDATGLIGFLVLMVALIGGYVWYISKKERARKQSENSPQ